MRITGGEWASRRVSGPPRGTDIRPTPDALREQAFAILAPRLGGAIFLDLFAGTGVNSLEALSRGAASAILVERARPAQTIIRSNLAAFGVEEGRATLAAGDASQEVRRLAGTGLRCSVAWCDPPFAAWEDGCASLALARSAGLLPRGALVVLEAPPRRDAAVPGFAPVRVLRGAVLLEAAAAG